MFAYGSNIHMLDAHIERLRKGMDVMGMEVPLWFDSEYFQEKIARLLQKNRFHTATRIRLAVFRNEGGLYTPSDNAISYCIETGKLENQQYIINKGNFSADIFPDMKKHPDILSPYKTGNSNIFIMAGLWRKKMGLDDCLILNTKDELCESVSSNIFLVKDNKLFTPAVDSGCVDGIMRKFIMGIAPKHGIEVVESGRLTVEDIYDADELFLTNSITGVRRVLSFKNKRFYSLISREIVEWINEELF
jgi:branched-chain amino acid aminotransferase